MSETNPLWSQFGARMRGRLAVDVRQMLQDAGRPYAIVDCDMAGEVCIYPQDGGGRMDIGRLAERVVEVLPVRLVDQLTDGACTCGNAPVVDSAILYVSEARELLKAALADLGD